jgi:lysophospholipase L1-like esterase
MPMHPQFLASRRSLIVWLACVTSLFHGAATAADEAVVTIVTLGDSITKGVRSGVESEETFAALVEAGLKKQGVVAGVINVGIGGERTDQALARLDTQVLSHKPRIVTIMYGTNDSFVDKGKKEPRLTVSEFRENLVEIVARLRAAGVTPVVMTEPRWGPEARNGLDENPNSLLEEYLAECRSVAKDEKVPLVDHYAHWEKAEADGTKIADWTTDQCHPNPAGHRVMAELMLPVLAKALREQATLPPRQDESAQDIEFFEREIRPILVHNCQKCHGDRKQEGGLRLDSREGVLKGGDTGPAIEAGNPAKSLLVEAIGYDGDTKMPPKGKLPGEQIAALSEWVKRGAPWPQHNAESSRAGEFDLAARKAKQWVFRPIREIAPPEVKNTAWPHSAIDRFILSQLEAQGLSPAGPTDKQTLLRRVTYDLIGLPPTAVQVSEFLADESPRAFERVVERLLDSPHYGECWARHWLDLVRFAETCGHEFDFELPYACEYRDYVIRALNADVPYNQFVMEHVAGDLFPDPRRNPIEHFNESVIGTGFWYLGEATHSPVDVRADEATRIDNQIDVFGKAFLGQTLACARCHDHKFDAISTKDYYAISGYLQSSRFTVVCVDAPQDRQTVVNRLDELKREEDKLLGAVAEQTARSAGARISKHLLASLAVLRPDADIESKPLEDRITLAAKQQAVEPPELALWVAHIGEVSLKNAADPFHLWALLANQPAKLRPDEVAASVREQVVAERNAGDRAASEPAEFQLFDDFSTADYAGWFVEGEAFGFGPAELPAGWPGGAFFAGLQGLATGRAAHSGLLSGRLEGVLRSRTFAIEKNFVLYHTAGKGAKINLIVDSLRLIQNPIYGGLTISLDSPETMKWHVQDVSKWIGHNAYIELIDPGDGFLAIDRILFADKGIPPEGANPVSTLLLEERKLKSPDEIAHAYERLIARALENRAGAKPQASPGPELAAQSAILNFLAANKLASTLAVSRSSIEKQLVDIAQSKQRLEGAIHYERRAMAMTDGTPEDDRVHVRGNPHKFGEVVPRRLLEALAGQDQPAPSHGSGRFDLARRMVDPANPVLVRVLVNRIWKHHFGEGLVRTPDDFGNMGQPPTHPELLDYLCREFVNGGWSIKNLHRLLLRSSTYQMSSLAADSRAEESDAQNRFWHRMPLRRLEGETIRDAILAVSGRLDRTMFGRGVPPYLTAFMVGRGRPAASGPLDGAGRRSVYLNVRRNFLNPMLLAFDCPIPFSTVGRRSVSNVPAQALSLMNNSFVLEQAEVWARRVLAEHSEPKDRIQAMYRSAFARPATQTELSDALAFLAGQSQQYSSDESARVWTDFAHVLFNTKEFIFVE